MDYIKDPVFLINLILGVSFPLLATLRAIRRRTSQAEPQPKTVKSYATPPQAGEGRQAFLPARLFDPHPLMATCGGAAIALVAVWFGLIGSWRHVWGFVIAGAVVSLRSAWYLLRRSR